MKEAMSATPPATRVPRKSYRRWYVLGGFLFLLAATPVGYNFVSGWLLDRELEAIFRELDADDPNWRWADLVAKIPAPPPDDRNAAVRMLKVADLLAATPFKLARMKNPADNPNARLSVEETKSLRGAFDKLGPNVVEEARKLRDLPEGRFPTKALENPLNNSVLGKIVPVMRLLQHDALLRGQEGKTEEAAESCQALLNAVYALDGYPAFMAYLIRSAGREFALEAVERTLANGIVSQERLQALQGALEREAESQVLYHATRGERAFAHQFFVQVKEGKISEANVAGDANPKSWIAARWDVLFPSRLVHSYAHVVRLQNEQVLASKLRDEAQVEAFRSVDKKLQRIGVASKPFMVAMVTPMVEEEQRMQARLRCAITAVAAERYRVKKGGWPVTADDLVKAGLLRELLKDPYNGQPLRWKRTATGVLVYSVGPDKTDNGGKLKRAAPGATGTDVGFELWAPELRGGRASANDE